MAIRTDGTLWAWGINSNGQLGDGTTTERHTPKQIGTATIWKQVATTASHTAAVTTTGALWAWGENIYGQLGDGTTADRHAPTRVGTATDWDAVAVGTAHTVGLRGNRSVWAMGHNQVGQLGDGTRTDSLLPVLAGTASFASQISAGGRDIRAQRPVSRARIARQSRRSSTFSDGRAMTAGRRRTPPGAASLRGGRPAHRPLARA